MKSHADLLGVRVGGAMGVMACLVGFAEFPMWFVGESMPRFWDAAAFAAFAARHGTLYLTRTLMDLLILGLLLIFFGGFRHLVVLARASYEWLATTFFGVALVWVALTLVSDALAATVAIDVADGRGDPTVIRALNESTVLLFGSAAESLVATLTSVAAVLILRTRALPRWTAWLALATAGVNLAFVPTMYFGADFTKYYSAAGDGPAATAPMMFVLWILATSICMLRTKTAPAEALAR